jgi:DNA-binding MarR family transcriptional regulator
MAPAKNSPADAASLPIDAPARRRLPPLLRRAWYGLNQAFRRRIAHTGATPDQFTALRCLLELEANRPTQRELTSAMSSDPNTIAALLERMEKAGWIERKPHERDGRAYQLQLKPAGRRKYEELRAIAVELQSQVMAALPAERRDGFLEDLSAIADACRAAAELSPLPARGRRRAKG